MLIKDGCELVDNTYQIIQQGGKILYSQVIKHDYPDFYFTLYKNLSSKLQKKMTVCSERYSNDIKNVYHLPLAANSPLNKDYYRKKLEAGKWGKSCAYELYKLTKKYPHSFSYESEPKHRTSK